MATVTKEQRSRYNRTYRQTHHEQCLESVREYHQSHKEGDAATNKTWRMNHKAEVKAYHQKYNREHKAQLHAAKLVYNATHKVELAQQRKDFRATHSEMLRKQSQINRQLLKVEILTHYGGGRLACVKCGFSDIRALSVDHINGDGSEHRERIGPHIYLWLRRNRYPEGFQTLCLNCQFIKRVENKELERIRKAAPQVEGRQLELVK